MFRTEGEDIALKIQTVFFSEKLVTSSLHGVTTQKNNIANKAISENIPYFITTLFFSN
jgi:hypothetical protein